MHRPLNHSNRSIPRRVAAALLAPAALLAAGGCTAPPTAAEDAPVRRALDPRPGSAIFVHPDGASAATWAIGRAMLVGPDGDLEWDRLPHMAVYRGHMNDSLTGTSNGGATVHATGVKVASSAYGRTQAGPQGRDLVDADGGPLSVALQAIRAGLPVGVVQTGSHTEPGTGCFLAPALERGAHEDIAAGLLESGAEVMLGGGERWFLPEGVQGVHGPGRRTDGRNLVDEARALGYRVVRTRAELLALPPDAERVLGLFAENHTFNARDEETLRARGLPRWVPGAPTVAEMTEVALRILGRGDRRFLLVVEEEATDNFGNSNNASGMIEAMERADAAIGVARRFVADRPDTLLITAADSDGGGMRMIGLTLPPGAEPPATLPERTRNGSPIDGVDGAGTAPFVAAPDRFGRRLPFAVAWAAFGDVSGGVLVRAEGHLAERVRGSMDNTEIPMLIREVLFGGQSPSRPSAAAVD